MLEAHPAVASRAIEDAFGGVQGEDRQFLAWLEGMLTAAVVGPERVGPTECMRAAMGEDHVYESAAMAESLLTAVALMHNIVATEIKRFRRDYQPRVLRESPAHERMALAAAWAEGFAAGTRLRPGSWDALIRSEQVKVPIAIVTAFLDGPDTIRPEISAEELAQTRVDLLPALGTAAFMLWKHCNGKSAGPAPAARLKLGRNDPCPCGSGKKHKKCCLGITEAED